MAPVGRLLVLRNAPKSELMNAIATITWPALFAPVIGPVLGAWITETFGWQWNFFINLPLGVICILLFLLLVRDEAPAVRRRFDWPGFGLCARGAVVLPDRARALRERRAGGAGPPLAAVGAGLGFLAVWHLNRRDEPLFELGVCRIPSFRMATMTAGTLGRIAINSTPFILPLLFQVGFGLSAIAAGQLVLVYFLGNLGMKAVTTPIMRRFGFRQVLIAERPRRGARDRRPRHRRGRLRATAALGRRSS